MHIASHEGRLEVAQLLLKHGTDVNACDQDRRTPLHMMSQGHLVVTLLLLDHSASVNVSDWQGNASSWLPLRRSHVEISQLLHERGR